MRKAVKVLIWGLSSKFGGIERYILNTANCLSADNYVVDCIIHDKHLPYLRSLESAVRHFLYVPPRRTSYFSYRESLENTLNKEHYDIVWMHVSSLSDLVLLRIAARYQVAVRIVHAHTTHPSGAFVTRILHALNKRYLRCASSLWACSEKSWHYMYGGMSAEKKHIAPNAVSPEEYVFSHQERENWRSENGLAMDLFLFGSVSRLSEVKNLSFLIPLFAELKSAGHREFRYVVVGEGPEEAKLRRLVDEYSLNQHVIFCGHRVDVARVYSALDCLLMPSFHEGIPFTILEAQMSGLPVVCSDNIDPEAIFSSRVSLLPLESRCWIESMQQHLRSWTQRLAANVIEVETSRNNIRVQSEKLKQQFSELLS